MRIREMTEPYVATHIIDEETGEILSSVTDTKKKKKVSSFNKYVGIDTRLPKDCLTVDQLLETLHIMDGYVGKKDKAKVSDTFLVENVLGGHITLLEQVFLRNLAQMVQGWNYYIGRLDEVVEVTGVAKKSIWRMLRTLEEKNFIKILRKDLPYKGDITITVNPLLAWNGDNQYRDNSRMAWYSIRNGIPYETTRK